MTLQKYNVLSRMPGEIDAYWHKVYLAPAVDEKIAALKEEKDKYAELATHYEELVCDGLAATTKNKRLKEQIATLEREKAEMFIAAPVLEFQHLIDRKQLLEHIAALKQQIELRDADIFSLSRIGEGLRVRLAKLQKYNRKLLDENIDMANENAALKANMSKSSIELEQENATLKEERDKYLVALDEISQFCDCEGPGCRYCDNPELHPPSAEARIAQAAIRKEEGK